VLVETQNEESVAATDPLRPFKVASEDVIAVAGTVVGDDATGAT
jgi:hypothetical protein